MSQDNVIQIPDKVTRVVRRIKDALANEGKNRMERIELTLDLCGAIAEARGYHSSDQAFGAWWDKQDFRRYDGKPLNKDERAAAIEMGRDLTKLRNTLTNSHRISLQTILTEFRFLNVQKPTSEPAKQKRERRSVNKVEAVAENLRAATGEIPDRDTLAQAAHVSPRSADNAIRAVKAADDARAEAKVTVDEETLAEAARASLPKSSQEKLDIVLRRERKRLEEEFEERARLQAQKILTELSLPFYNEKLKFYEAVVAGRSGVFTKAEFDQITKCLHSDHVMSLGPKTVQQHDAAFILFRKAEIKLVNEDESPLMGERPWTLAELDRRRKKPSSTGKV